jgi:hypothetical protein
MVENAGPEAASRPCNQPLTLPELRPTFGRKLLDRERGSARHCGLDLLAHLSLGRSGTPLRGGGVLFRHAASLSGMSQLTACAISTSQGTRSGSGRGMRPSANALASSMRFWGEVQDAGHSPAQQHQRETVDGLPLPPPCAFADQASRSARVRETPPFFTKIPNGAPATGRGQRPGQDLEAPTIPWEKPQCKSGNIRSA